MSNQPLDLPLPDRGEHTPYALMGTARAKAGQADALEQRLVALIAPTRQEDGALAYHVHRDRGDADLFVFYEAWSSVEALRDHLSQPYVTAFLAERHTYLEGDLDIRWLRMSNAFT